MMRDIKRWLFPRWSCLYWFQGMSGRGGVKHFRFIRWPWLARTRMNAVLAPNVVEWVALDEPTTWP